MFKKFFLEISETNENWIKQFLNDGLVTFKATTVEDFLNLANRFGSVYIQDDTDNSGIKIISGRPAKNGSNFHTDRASMLIPPNTVFIFCLQASTVGGESIFSDGKKIYDELKANYPHIIQAFLKPNSLVFGMENYLSLGSILNIDPHMPEYLFFKYRQDPHIYYQRHLFQFLEIFENLIGKNQFKFKLEKGCGYMLQNGRWFHGALPSQDDNRTLARILIDCENSILGTQKLPLGFCINE